MKNKCIIIALIVLSSVDIYAQHACYFTSKGDSVCFDIQQNSFIIHFSTALQADAISTKVDSFITSTPFSGKIDVITDHSIAFYGDQKDFIRFSQCLDNFDYNYSNILLSKDSCICWASNRLIVLLKPGKDLLQILEECEIPYENTRRLGYDSNMYLISTTGVEDRSLAYANQLFKSGDVVFAQPDLVRIVQAANNSYYSDQWGLNNTGQYNGQSGIDIKAENAWELSSGLGIRVAVIDEGVDLTHPDLANNLTQGYDATDAYLGGSNGSHTGNNAHGTACAGIVAAIDNNIGVKGVSYNAKVIPVRIAYRHSNFPHSWITCSSWIVDGIYHAWHNANADILSLSWSGVSAANDESIELEIANAFVYGRNNKGCVIVCSSGNYKSTDASSAQAVQFPAILTDYVITVGAISPCGERKTPLSCDGENWWGSCFGEQMGVVAPGVLISTTDIQGSSGCNSALYFNYSNDYNNEDYTKFFNGTSSACPHVSGIAALMLSINPALTATQVRNIIELTAQKVRDINEQNGLYSYAYNLSTHPNGTWNQEMGYGLVDAHKAVVHAMEYGHDNITGSSTIADCDAKIYQCNFLHPELFTYSWSASSNLSIIEELGSMVKVIPVSVGTGTLTVDVYQQGRLMYTLTKNIQVTSIWSGVSPVSTSPFQIGNNTSWSTNTYLPVTVTVDQNVTLTITGTVLCGEGARIIVRPGGKLIVDGGTLTSACTGEMWKGIFVEGHSNLHQNAANQGTVVLRNGALIENALCGIRTSAPDDANNTSTGGIITAQNSTFHNCARAVEFLAYTDVSASGFVNNNLGSFKNCTFTVDDDNLFAANGTSFLDHVSLWAVKGVRFLGCTFKNLTSNTNGRRHAIYAYDAGFVVDEFCDGYDPLQNPPVLPGYCGCPPELSNPCLFEGFATAIEAGTDGMPFAVTVNRARFANNGTGVRINANNFATVTECDFDLTDCDEAFVNQVYGLYLDNCTGYKVEGNAFYRETYPNVFLEPDNRMGILVKASGLPVNNIYRNNFAKLTKGVDVSGFNSGLQIGCCDFSQNSYDIHIPSTASIAASQGNLSAGADNVFGQTQVSSICYAGLQKLTYYYSTGNGHAPYSPTGVTLNYYATANACASTLCSGEVPQPPVTLAAFTSMMSAYTSAIPSPDATEPPTNTDGFAVQQPQCDGSTVSGVYYTAVRSLMADSLLDMASLEHWHAAAQPIADPYSLAETRFALGYDEGFYAGGYDAAAETQPSASLQDYSRLHAMKRSLRGGDGNTINWYALTPVQIAQLQDLAENGTGRASVMARSVLCFFFGICYDDDEDGSAEMRRASAKSEGYMSVLTDDTVTFSIAFGPLPVKSDSLYLGAQSILFAGSASDTAIFDNKTYRVFKAVSDVELTEPGLKMYLREDTTTGQLFRYYPEVDTEVITCDMSLQPGDTFCLSSGNYSCWTVDSVTYDEGRKVIWFPPVAQYGNLLSAQYPYHNCFIEGVGPVFGPFGIVNSGIAFDLGLLLCVHHNDFLVYMTDTVLGCVQYAVSIPEYPNVSMKLYPNPATNTLHVELEGLDDPQGTITVADITGVVVFTRECHGPVTQLDVSHLTPGLYVVSFRNKNGVAVRKFVKM